MPRRAARLAIKLPRVLFVTGKGGTGKSTIAHAFAVALARDRKVTLVEINPRYNAVSSPLDLSTDRSSSEFVRKQLTPRGELEAFVEGLVPLKAISRRMLQSRTFGFVTAALPGLEAFLLLDRLRKLAREARPTDAIVVDAPATGGALEMLTVGQSVGAIAPLGTLNRLAREVETFIGAADQFGVILTLRPEKLALREALDAARILEGAGIGTVAAVLNAVPTELFSAAEIAQLKPLPEHRALAQERRVLAHAAAHARRELEREQLRVIETPMIYRASLGRDEFEELADVLGAGGIR